MDTSVESVKKHYKLRLCILTIMTLVLGVVLLINPKSSLNILAIVFAIMLIAFAAAAILQFFLGDESRKIYDHQFVLAALAIASAVFLLKNTELMWSLLGILNSGIFMALAGYQIQITFVQFRKSFRNWWLALIFALIFIGFGIYTLTLPGEASQDYVNIYGALLIISAVINVGSFFTFNSISVEK